jgi:sugar diacid utilization regulator
MDQDLRELASEFLEFVHGVTKQPMIVCDDSGTIVEAVDRKRIGSTHAGAQRIMRHEVDEVFVTPEEAARDPRMKPGASVPIVIDGKRVGTFGLTGPLEVSQPVVRIAAAVLASWIKERRRTEVLNRAASTVFSDVKTVSTRIAALTAQASHVSTGLDAAAAEASSKAADTEEVVRTVQEIARKSRILSINGAVEAARSGDHGLGFAVIAKEMLSLAEGARSAANQIDQTLRQIQAANGHIATCIGESTALTRSQAAAFEEVARVVASLQGAVSEATTET